MLKTLIEIWKDRDGGISLAAIGSILSAVSSAVSIGQSLFGGGKKDKAPAAPTVLADQPKPAQTEPQLRQATDRARRRRASSVGRKDTILTSPLGLSDDGDVARTSLLGQ